MMRGHPQEHLLQTWAGILQQQEDDGLQDALTHAHLRHEAEMLWSACAGATLVSCRTLEGKDEDAYSRCNRRWAVQ